MSEQIFPRNQQFPQDPGPQSTQESTSAGQQPEAIRPQPAQPTDQNSGSSWAWGEARPAQPQSGQSGSNGPSAGWGAPSSETSGSGWGSAPGGRDKAGVQNRWSVKKTLIVAGVAVVVAAGTAAGFYSLGSAGSADAANVPLGQAGGLGGQQGQAVPGQGLGPGGSGQDGTGQGMPGQMGGQMGGMAPDGFGGGLNAAIHSEYVILRDNEYVSMADQVGVVSEVSSNSLTVKSTDGFTRTYVLGTDTAVAQRTRQRGGTSSSLTIADITSGATVRVTAAKSGDAYNASSVRLTTATSSTGQGSTSGSGTTS
ncbi:hypothetical protein [Paenarthrobacter sp. JL.01a]|uniref:hypothetical protein n=1 Tax=Paenarthrobacter sp. JL.01a TaxID=2979324 RepID=UPI0021CA251A|nr:hypothetical protein [Paenarthrobacter sp. JL.01a]UXM92416.1 hypothetical protein N5P29_03580 [Paenarthrobacter sp. JL.01a]